MLRSLALIEPLEPRRLLAVLLPGFVETAVTGDVVRGTTLEISPDGKLFVVEQRGTLQVYSGYTTPNQLLQPNFFRDAPPPVDPRGGERGMIGFAFDPDYEHNRYVYVHYTHSVTPNSNRVSRFTANATGDLALPGSEVVLLEIEPPVLSTIHNGGALHFGPDGKLYVAVGDHGPPANAQSLTTLKGKILRVNATPGDIIPEDNPASIAGIPGTTSGVHRTIWAAGLRNPYTFAFQPSTGRMFINDVGALREEINEGGAGRNYGWPITDGDFDPKQFPDFTRPLLTPAANAIVGGAFYEPAMNMFPPDYSGDYFFGSYFNSTLGGYIARMDLVSLQVQAFANAVGPLSDLRIAPDGSLLYTVNAISGGRVFRVMYDDIAPTVTASAFEFDGVKLPGRPHRLNFAFSESVSASLAPSDLTLVNLSTGQAVPSSALSLSYDPTADIATFTFSGFSNAILPDGNYRATLRAAGVTDAAGNPLPADHVADFFVLSADANRDGTVNVADFKILAANFGQSGRFAQGDFTYDGRVNLADFNILASRFGQQLSAAFSGRGSGIFNGSAGVGTSDDGDRPDLLA
jgi:glucose/arabinose dehydrogenase